MMLIALDAVTGLLLDITMFKPADIDMLNGKRVARRHGHEPVCQGCGGAVHLVVNHHKTTFFRHDPGGGRACILSEFHGGESEEHIEGKITVVAAMRSLRGWIVQPERRYDTAGEFVIVDVAADFRGPRVHPAQVDVAFEVQLAAQTAGEFTERTRTIRRLSGAQAQWITPQAERVGDAVAIICDPQARYVTGRLLQSYEPEIPLPATPLDRVLRALHRRNPAFQLVPYGEYGEWYVIDKDAHAAPKRVFSISRTPAAIGDTDHVHTPCTRPARDEWPHFDTQPLFDRAPEGDRDVAIIDATAATDLDANQCATCPATVADPWGFTGDPPRCRTCFLADPHLYFDHHRVGAS